MNATDARLFSLEFFPPRTPEGIEKLRATRRQLAQLKPSFASVTYGAGGSTRPNVKDLYTAQGMAPLGSASPEEFGKFFLADFDRVAKLIKIAGIKPE